MKFQVTYLDRDMNTLKEEEVDFSAFEDAMSHVINEATYEIDGVEVAGLSIIPEGQF